MVKEIEAGYYTMRVVVKRKDGELETIYSPPNYFFNLSSFHEARKQWKDYLESKQAEITKEITFKRYIAINSGRWAR